MKAESKARSELREASKNAASANVSHIQSYQKGQDLVETRDIKDINRDRYKVAKDIPGFTYPKAAALLQECLVRILLNPFKQHPTVIKNLKFK